MSLKDLDDWLKPSDVKPEKLSNQDVELLNV